MKTGVSKCTDAPPGRWGGLALRARRSRLRLDGRRSRVLCPLRGQRVPASPRRKYSLSRSAGARLKGCRSVFEQRSQADIEASLIWSRTLRIGGGCDSLTRVRIEGIAPCADRSASVQRHHDMDVRRARPHHPRAPVLGIRRNPLQHARVRYDDHEVWASLYPIVHFFL